MKFYGNEICCGSYACLNAMKNKNIDLQLFEITTSAPFGLRHFENMQFDRLLTTYRDPGKGMDQALRLWGYQIQKYTLKTAKEAVKILKENLWDNRAVLGPVDMGELGYQMVPQLLKRMDHYIALEYWSEKEILCHDSEGFCGNLMDYDELGKYIAVKEIPESEGNITIRFIREENETVNPNDILKRAYYQAAQNLRDAEAEGQGSGAIMQCFEFLKEKEVYLWKLPLLYDLQYLMQRKWLLKILVESAGDKIKGNEEQHEKIKVIADRQVELAGKIYGNLNEKNKLDQVLFEQLEVCEKELSILLCIQSHCSGQAFL